LHERAHILYRRRGARAAKAVKREDVMRDDLTFHVLRITSIVASAHVGRAFIFQTKRTFIF